MFTLVVLTHDLQPVGMLVTLVAVNSITVILLEGLSFPLQVSMWVQLQIPKIEDGNNFGVAVQVSSSWGSRTPAVFHVLRWLFGPMHHLLCEWIWCSSFFLSFRIRRKYLSCWLTHAPKSRDFKPRFQSKSWWPSLSIHLSPTIWSPLSEPIIVWRTSFWWEENREVVALFGDYVFTS